ncbi:hypothetical protein [Brachyspira murdochii]|uniref:hypothetical protein n=1 Tax=Brachyspira murdochii TaxID=84378 RepID=UPI0012F4D722|nr:hypothetical protein [Brachyspira murdochii]
MLIGCNKNKIESYIDGKENSDIISSYDKMIISKSYPSLRYKIKPVETDKDINLLPSDFAIIQNFTSKLKKGEEKIMEVAINKNGLKKIYDEDVKKINLKLKIKSNLKTGEEAVSYLNTNIKIYNLTLRYILWILCYCFITIPSIMYYCSFCYVFSTAFFVWIII